MYNWFRMLFVNSVDTIVADFHKVVTRLEELADIEENKAEALYTAAQEQLKEREERLIHAAKASKVASKIRDLLNA